ncbi:MAG: LacI family DNA-binding transcriptional regulator [Geminicoccaceae bacterium]
MNAGSERPARPRRRGPSIEAVAAMAGVSIATVSRTLTNPDRVSAATRERVLETVRQAGYTPSFAGRNLRAARSMMVLAVVPTIITPFFSQLLLGVDRGLSAHGYGMLVGNLHDSPGKEERLADFVYSGQAEGALLLDGRILRGRHGSLADIGAPLVAVSVPSDLPSVPTVLVDERGGAAQAARHLLDLGHRRFGYVSGPPGHIDEERWLGFSETLADAGIAADSVVRWQGDFHVASGLAAGTQFLGLRHPPTAIFAASDMMAIGFIRALHEDGRRVPEDVSIVGFDGIEFADYCEPPLTTVRQPREEMGRTAAEILVRMIQGETLTPAESLVTLDVKLRRGASTAPPSRR